ncbi:MAG TPA: alpha/beta hydrolase [Pyrinomonadaceae bacterium]|jgi:pimeloyl-ACP methyl ester carboxylesterase
MKRSLRIIFFLLLATHGWATVVSAQPQPGETTARKLETASAQEREIEGNWQGVIQAGPTKLRLVLKISRATDGSLKASVDSPDQGALNLPVDTVAFKDRALRFEMKQLSAGYEGTLSRDRSEIVGTWRQGGNSIGLLFRRSDGATQASAATVVRGRVQFRLCGRDELPKDALCGQYEVFENRAARTGRKLALNILLLPALSEKPAPDPLFYLAGGPGGAATNYATAWFMTRLRRERDVVLVDQRGTGKSNPLNCKLHGELTDMRGFFVDYFSEESLKNCRTELEKVADLTLYSTEIAMDDLDEVRAALGYGRINLYGGSYGTTAALSYLRQHPKQVRAVALFGVAPPDYKIPLPFAKGVQHAMNRLIEDCAADNACRAAFPNLRAEFEALLARLDKGAVNVTATNVVTKQQQELTLSRAAFVDIIRLMLYFPPTLSVLPSLIHQASQGNFGPLVTIAFQVLTQLEGQIARGMQLSVICAEDVPFISEQDIKRETAGTFYGETRVRAFVKACEGWPKSRVQQSFSSPVKSDAPVLLVSGEIDPVTPSWIATAASRNLPNSRQVLIRNGSHYSYECAENLVAEFIERGTTEGLDASCLEQIRRLPFSPGRQ